MSKNIVIKKKIEPFNKIISVSGDKSISIRCVLLASQAIGETKINNLLESEDVLNSLRAIKKLGIKFKKKGGYYFIYGLGIKSFNAEKKLLLTLETLERWQD